MKPKRITEHELKELVNAKKKRTLIVLLLAASMLFSAVILFFFLPPDFEYRYYVIAAVVVFDVLFMMYLMRAANKFTLDIHEQLKYTGMFRIVKKESSESSSQIVIEPDVKRKITITPAWYETINEGDEVYLEFAKNSNHLFVFSKEDPGQ